MVGRDTALLIHDYETPVRVQGYNEDVGERSDCRIVSAVVAYVHPASGDVYMLVIHQAILIPSMPHNLLCLMQLQDHGLTVNDEPKYMALNPMEEHHAITSRDRNTQVGGPLRIPLELHGVTSYFLSRKPTKEEYENTPEDLCVELTAEAPDWDPASKTFQQQEEAMLQADGQLKDSIESWGLKRTISVLNTIAQPETPEFHLCDAIHSHVLASPDAHLRRPPRPRALRNYGTNPLSWNHIFALTLLSRILNSMGKFLKLSCLAKLRIFPLLLHLGGTSGSSTTTQSRVTPSTRRSLVDGLALQLISAQP